VRWRTVPRSSAAAPRSWPQRRCRRADEGALRARQMSGGENEASAVCEGVRVEREAAAALRPLSDAQIGRARRDTPPPRRVSYLQGARRSSKSAPHGNAFSPFCSTGRARARAGSPLRVTTVYAERLALLAMHTAKPSVTPTWQPANAQPQAPSHNATTSAARYHQV
jgi:hypothetical protein